VAKKRANGEGSISKRNDGLWQGSISLGYDDKGKRKRKTRYGRTQAEVRQKLDALKRQMAGGTFSDVKLKLKRLFRAVAGGTGAAGQARHGQLL